MAYIYEDFSFVDSRTGMAQLGHYSGDLRVLANMAMVKLEGFSGITLAKDTAPIFRGGLLAHFDSGKGVDFLFQCGIPGWQQGNEFNIDNLFFLIEPRIRFGIFGVGFTFFYHPLWYLQVPFPEEQGRADVNVKFSLGDLFQRGVEGGLESTVHLKSDNIGDLSVFLSPFISFITGGIRWDSKVRINFMAFDAPAEMFELFMGIQSSY
jgi:hypothetical protein